MTRSRPYKKDDNAHVEQKNWTHIRQFFGYERHDNPEVVERINVLAKGAYGQLLNYFHASLKLERKERKEGRSPSDLRRGPNTAGAGDGQRRGYGANQEAIGAGESPLESVRVETRGDSKPQGDCCVAPDTRWATNENPPPIPQKRLLVFDRRGRERRLEGSPPARLTCDGSPKKLLRPKTKKQKQQSHRVTPLLAQRITFRVTVAFGARRGCSVEPPARQIGPEGRRYTPRDCKLCARFWK